MASSYEISPRRDSGNEQLIEGDGERASDYDCEDPQDPNAFSYEAENTEGYDDVLPSSPSVSEQHVNMSEVQGNVGTALRNAFDMSKMVSAFDNIFTVFNDQQSSMSQMTQKFSTLKSEAAQKFQSVDDSIGMLKRSDQTNSETIRSLRHALQAKMESEQLLTGRSKSLASYAFADKCCG
jgi:cysteinyl-tRNA synthetase